MTENQSSAGRVRVAVDKCAGHARCAATAPEIYELNDDGYNVTPEMIVAADLKPAARRGARACPERVITVEDIG